MVISYIALRDLTFYLSISSLLKYKKPIRVRAGKRAVMKFANGICLITDNVATLSEFYQTVLQIAVEINSLHVVIAMEGGGITIYSKTAAEHDMGFHFDKYHGNGMCKFTILVEDVDAEYERLQALHMEIDFMAAPTTYPWGARSMHFRDPDGNIVCFVNLANRP